MGASDQGLTAFFDRWSDQYAIAETQPESPIVGGHWLAHVGNVAAFDSLRKHFAGRFAYTCYQESARDPGSPYYLAAASRIASAPA